MSCANEAIPDSRFIETNQRFSIEIPTNYKIVDLSSKTEIWIDIVLENSSGVPYVAIRDCELDSEGNFIWSLIDDADGDFSQAYTEDIAGYDAMISEYTFTSTRRTAGSKIIYITDGELCLTFLDITLNNESDISESEKILDNIINSIDFNK